ncbi:MAG: hypothetical protein WDZ59_08540 [Pirellulales bacterium]
MAASGSGQGERATASRPLELPPAAAQPRRTASRGNVLMEVTPWGAFACGALAVSLLALAFALGRSTAGRPATGPAAPQIKALDQARRTPPLRYDTISVDRGRDALADDAAGDGK